MEPSFQAQEPLWKCVCEELPACKDVQGTPGDDVITCKAPFSPYEKLDLGEGNDRVTVKGGMGTNGTILGGPGNDIIVIDGDLRGGIISAGRGDDTLVVTGTVQGTFRKGGRAAQVNGGDGADTITVKDHVFGYLSGGAGDDSIAAETSESWVGGGGGNDTIDIRKGVSGVVDGGFGDDKIWVGTVGPKGVSIGGGPGTDDCGGKGHGIEHGCEK
ncbi:hypothetical protein [Streptomyces formicae]